MVHAEKKKRLPLGATASKPSTGAAVRRQLSSRTKSIPKQAPPKANGAHKAATPTCLDAALTLVGWKVFPARIENGKKYSWLSEDYAPGGLRWGQTNDPEQLKKNFKNAERRDKKQETRTGVHLGIPTGADNGFFVVEADTKEGGHKYDGIAELKTLEAKHGKLPDTLMARSPSGSLHHYFNYPPGIMVKGSIGDDEGHGIAPGIDVKSDGGMVIAPPSMLPDGRAYVWLNDLPIVDAPDWLIDLVREEQSDGNSKNWAEQYGDERDAVSIWEIELALCVTPIPPYADYINIGRGIWDGSKGSAAGYLAFDTWSKQSPEYDKPGGERGAKYTMQKWMSFANTNEITVGTVFHFAEQAEPDWKTRWHEPGIKAKYDAFQQAKNDGDASAYQKLMNETPKNETPKNETPKDEASAAPQQAMFDPWAKHIVPPFPIDVLPPVLREFVVSQSEVIGVDHGSVAMVVLGTVSGAIDHRFRVKMMEHGNWYVRPRLWVLLYGDASFKKTPIFDNMTQPLEDYQSELQEEYQQNLIYHEIAVNMAKVKGKEPPEKIQRPTRYVVYDTTIEKLGELLERSGRGLLVKRDEFSGWIGSMEKYTSGKGGSANRAFYLKAYDGGAYIVDRLSRDEQFIKLLSISLIGGIQPEKLIELHGLTSDGLLQRFLPVVMSHTNLPIDRAVNIKDYTSLVRTLIRQKPTDLMFKPEALEIVTETREYLYRLGQSVGGMGGAFQSFIGKLDGLIGSLAINLHMALPRENPSGWGINKTTVLNVRRLLRDFLIPHALEFYRVVDIKADGDQLRKLASWVLTNGKERLVASDLTSNIASFRGLSVEDVNERVSPLIAGGWLQPMEKGNWCRAWTVKPEVFVEFAARLQEEERRKQELADLFNSPRRSK